MNRFLSVALAIFSLFSLLPSLLWGADTKSLTVTQNRGLGVNQPSDRTFVTTTNGGNFFFTGSGPLAADSPRPLTGGGCPFACYFDTSDPFFKNGTNSTTDAFVDPLLPPSFSTPDTQFGKGAPCGPTDTNKDATGAFPYPCSSAGTMKLSFFDLGTIEGTFKITAPNLSPGSPFQTFISAPLGGGFRKQTISYGFTQDSAGGSNISAFYSISTVNGPDGRLVGFAEGNFITSTSGVSPLSCDRTFQGTFQSDNLGMVATSCVNNDGTPCQSPKSIPNYFTRPGISGC